MLTAAHRINKRTTIAVVRPWPAITAAALTLPSGSDRQQCRR
jgi:hypothetical protein